jgi:uncharacterized membrane protein
MTDQKAQPAQAPAFRTNRMEAFSDGVFAIAITLLVLEIAVPPGSESNLLGPLLHEWPSYLAYLVSFSTVGAIWLGHSVITEFLDRATPVFIRLNLVLLMVVSFLPFPTKFLADYIGADRPERVAATIYGLNLRLFDHCGVQPDTCSRPAAPRHGCSLRLSFHLNWVMYTGANE